MLYPVHYIADSNVWYFSEFDTWLEIWTTKIKMLIPNKEQSFNCGRKWSKSGLKLTQLKTEQTICLPCRHNQGKHCTHGAHCVETLFWYVWGRHDVMFYFFIDENRFRFFSFVKYFPNIVCFWNTLLPICHMYMPLGQKAVSRDHLVHRSWQNSLHQISIFINAPCPLFIYGCHFMLLLKYWDGVKNGTSIYYLTQSVGLWFGNI